VIVVIAGALAAITGLCFWKWHNEARRQRVNRRATIKRVERRRRLQKRLERKAGDPLSARALTLQQARRLGASPTSIEALEAALRQIAESVAEQGDSTSFSKF
jgi:hypothetical protein